MAGMDSKGEEVHIWFAKADRPKGSVSTVPLGRERFSPVDEG